MNRLIHSIPNTITSLNLLSGAMAIIASFHGSDTVIQGLTGYQAAWMFIAAAALFDFCDGLSARLLGAHSIIGKELDSLADLVSFGLAPGMVMYNHLATLTNGPLPFIALFIPVMGAIRLARFNVDDRQTTTFIGLPIPSNAIFWIGYSAWLTGNHTPILPDGTLPAWAIALTVALIIAVPLLMVSNLRMFSLKFKDLRPAHNPLRYLIILATIALLATIGIQGLAVTIVLYLLLSLIDRKQS